MKKGLRALMAVLMIAMLLPVGYGVAEDEVFEGQATYWSPETSSEAEVEAVAYDGDPNDLLYVEMFKPNGSLWVIVPEGIKAADYLGKGIRYTVDEVVREASDDHFEMVRAKTIEVFAESAEGTLKEISDTEAIVDVILRSGPSRHKDETMRFTITPETVIQTSGDVDIYVNVLYDADMNALYVIQGNG